ncbi:hypothetical protein TruAng_000569 [Truncatella angustata]|nr:hypothetical protein TruAng_000569 [Truncatella angustata]
MMGASHAQKSRASKPLAETQRREAKAGFNSQQYVLVKRVPIAFSRGTGWKSELRYIGKSSEVMSLCPYTVGYSGARESDNATHMEILRDTLSGNVYQLKTSGVFPLRELVDATCRSLLKALHHLAKHGIVHRDVRPENILYRRDLSGDITLKLANFGLRIDTSSSRHNRKINAYRAPEAYTYEAQTHASDMWSLFATLCELADRYHPGSYRTYPEAWARLYDIATTVFEKGTLDLRGVREAVVWDAGSRAAAAQLLDKFGDGTGVVKPGTQVSGRELTPWTTWVDQVGGSAVAKGLYEGTWDILPGLPGRSRPELDPGRRNRKSSGPFIANETSKTVPQVTGPPSTKFASTYNPSERIAVEDGVRNSMCEKTRRVTVEEIRQCPDPQIGEALASEMNALLQLSAEIDAPDRSMMAAEPDLAEISAARNALEVQVAGLQEAFWAKDDVVAQLWTGGCSLPSGDATSAGELNMVDDNEERAKTPQINGYSPIQDNMETDVTHKADLMEVVRAKDAIEAQLGEAVEARGFIQSRMTKVLPSSDQLKAQPQIHEEILRARDTVIPQLEVANVTSQCTTAAGRHEEVNERLQEALEAKETRDILIEAIEAITFLESRLSKALESRDQLKSQLEAFDAERVVDVNGSIISREDKASIIYRGRGVVVDSEQPPHSNNDLQGDLSQILEEKSAIEAQLRQAATERLAAEAKLKDAVGARRSAEEQIRKAGAARKAVEASLKTIRNERDALRIQASRAAADSSDVSNGRRRRWSGTTRTTQEESFEGAHLMKAPGFTYRMDPMVAKRQRHFSSTNDTLVDMDICRKMLNVKGRDHSLVKRRKLVADFGGPPTSRRNQHLHEFGVGPSGGRRMRI